MKKFYLLLIFLILTACSSGAVLRDISFDPNFKDEKLNDVFIIVQSNGFKSQDKFYQKIVDNLKLQFKNRGLDTSGIVYDENMVNGEEILRQKINIFNPKYVMELRLHNDFIISIKEFESQNEIWKAFLGNPLISSEKFSQAVIQELEKDKILKKLN